MANIYIYIIKRRFHTGDSTVYVVQCETTEKSIFNSYVLNVIKCEKRSFLIFWLTQFS